MAGASLPPDFSRSEVPEVVVSRLPQYLRILNRLMDDGITVVSSQQLGEKLQVTPPRSARTSATLGVSASRAGATAYLTSSSA